MSKQQIPSLERVQQELERRQMQSDAEYFIQSYVRIEDVDQSTGSLDVPFTLWPGQKQALRDFIQERLNIVLKARQLGLTWLALAFAIWCMIFAAGFQVVALSKREDPDAKELVRRIVFILRHLPPWLIQEQTADNKGKPGLKWTSTTMSVTILHKDAPSVFQSMAASADSGRSFTANLVILDEWAFQQWAREIWAAAYPTINRPTGGKVIGLSTAKRMTLFEEIYKKARVKANTFNPIFLPWHTDPRRTPEWYSQTKRDLGEHTTKAEYPSTPEEAFEAAEGVAFPEFSYDIHVCEPFPIPAHWPKWRSVDNGYTDPFAWYWYAVNEQGTVFIYQEFTREEKDPKLIYTDQAKKVMELSRGEQNIRYTVAGHDAWAKHHRDSSNKNLIDYYQDGGLFGFKRANIDRALRKATWHQYLKPYEDENIGITTAKVQIFSTCEKLIETLPQLICDDKDVEKVMECGHDHWFDGAGYGLISHHQKQSGDMSGPQPVYNFPSERPKPDPFRPQVNNSYINFGS